MDRQEYFKRNKIWIILTAAILTVLIAFVSVILAINCANDRDYPTRKQFEVVGITKRFDPVVKGTVEISTFNGDEKAIEIKWTGSNDTSFENIMKYLKRNDYDKYNGKDTNYIVCFKNSFLFYIAEKTVNGEKFYSLMFYFRRDFSHNEQTYKKGELYLGFVTSFENGDFGFIDLPALPYLIEH